MRWIIALLATAGIAHADQVVQVEAAAKAAFARMPDVVIVERITGQCGADEGVSNQVAYCTTSNEILLARAAQKSAEIPYLLSHAYGHAVQVKHGVADIALRAITSRPQDEAVLRGDVERQVDCIAGYIMQRAGFTQIDLTSLFRSDPLDMPHWGRNPLRIGPVVAVPLEARADWFLRGQAGDLSVCSPGEFAADLLLEAVRSP